MIMQQNHHVFNLEGDGFESRPIKDSAFFVVCEDRFMSSWGPFEQEDSPFYRGRSMVLVPCSSKSEADRVAEYAGGRPECRRVRVCSQKPLFRPNDLVSITIGWIDASARELGTDVEPAPGMPRASSETRIRHASLGLRHSSLFHEKVKKFCKRSKDLVRTMTNIVAANPGDYANIFPGIYNEELRAAVRIALEMKSDEISHWRGL